jgi:hypothetical protein
MPAKDDHRELVPAINATIVAAIGALFLWSDLRNNSPGRGDGMVTFAVASRAGAMVTPSEPSAHLVVQQAVPASEPLTVGRVTFSRSDLRYDPTSDVYHCPGEARLDRARFTLNSGHIGATKRAARQEHID